MTDLENEAVLFAEDLFSDCMSLHPIFQKYLPEHSRTLTKSSNFDHAVSRSIMVILEEFGEDLTTKFRRDFNSFSKNEADLKLYLESLSNVVRDISSSKLHEVLGLSAVLLELIAFLYKRGHTNFSNNAPHYWLLMFKNICYDEFYESGGWAGLTKLSKELEETASKEASSDIGTDFASGLVITEEAGLDTHSEDKVGTDFEGEKPSNVPIIPKALEPTKQFPQEVTPKEHKALDSKDEGRKLDLSKVKNEPLEKKDPKYVFPNSKQLSKKDTVSDHGSSLSRGSSAPMDIKYHTPNVVKKTSASPTKIYKRTTLDKPRGKSGMSTSASDKSSPSKTDSGSTRSTDTVPKGENTGDASIQSFPKAVTEELEKVDSSDRKNPDEQGASSTVSSDSTQNVPQDRTTTEDSDLNTSTGERSSKKDASASSRNPQST